MKTNGPVDLDTTMGAGQTSGVWFEMDEGYAKVVDGSLFRISEGGGAGEVLVTGDLPAEELEELGSVAVTADYPFDEFLRMAMRDPGLREAVEERSGLRLSLSLNAFEGLICSVLSQNTRVEMWREVASNLSKKFGEVVDGLHSFPSPEALASASEEEVRRCGAGYRAPYVLDAANWFVEGGLEEIERESVEEAREGLCEVDGIGPKVADCVLLYVLGEVSVSPVDVHVRRCVRKDGYEDCDSRLGGFGEHAGLAQLYLYDHERRS